MVRRIQRLREVLSRDEVAAILRTVRSPRHRAVLMTMYGAGLRVGEACRLRPTDIDSQRGVIRVRDGKGGRDRVVMLSPRLLEELRSYWRLVRPSGGYFFPAARGGVLRSESVRAVLKRAAASLGIAKRVTPHCLRHSFATQLLGAGTDALAIQVLLGHASIETTQRYMQVSAQFLSTVQRGSVEMEIERTSRCFRRSELAPIGAYSNDEGGLHRPPSRESNSMLESSRRTPIGVSTDPQSPLDRLEKEVRPATR